MNEKRSTLEHLTRIRTRKIANLDAARVLAKRAFEMLAEAEKHLPMEGAGALPRTRSLLLEAADKAGEASEYLLNWREREIAQLAAEIAEEAYP